MPAPPAGSRRERRKREVHDRIVEAAVEIFDRQGFDGTKVEEICELADVAHKTFYNHFATKQHLLRELADGLVERLHSTLEEIRRRPGSTRDRIARFFRQVAEETEQSGLLERELILEVIRVSQAEGAGPEQRRKLLAAFRDLLGEGVERGDVGDAYGVDFLAEITMGIYTTLVLNWISLPDYPLADRLDEATRFLGDSIALRRTRAGTRTR